MIKLDYSYIFNKLIFKLRKNEKIKLKPNVFEKGEVLSRTQLKKVMGGVGSSPIGSGTGDYMCQCDGKVAILWSAQASINWVNANCSGQYQCDQLPNPQ